MSHGGFPDTFLWGVATSGHQSEGDNVDSDTWFLEHVTPTVFRAPSGPACRSWDLWETDLDLVADLGLTAYRFSVEWSRVEPQPGVVSAAALDHYDALVDGCLARGLAPLVTLNHFTAPAWFGRNGSWLAADATDRFADQCTRVAERLGDRLAAAVTLNEPNLPRLLTWILPDAVFAAQDACLDAASLAAGVPRFRAANVVRSDELDALEDGMAAGHLAGRAALKAVRPDLPAGLSLAVVDDRAVGDDTSVRDRKRAACYARWWDVVRGDDLVGVQNYERRWYDGTGPVEAPAGVRRNQMGSAIAPESLGEAVRYVHAGTGLPVFVTEHGMATPDDADRTGFLEPALEGLRAAVADGVPVLGYTHWTLLDNFEWIFGYGQQLGLHAVDRTTFRRTPKPSARVYADLVRRYRTVPAPG